MEKINYKKFYPTAVAYVFYTWYRGFYIRTI